MRRILIGVIAVMLFASATGVLAEYDSHVTFTASSYSDVVEGDDYSTDEVYKYLQEMLNFDSTFYRLNWEDGAEKNRLWIVSGEMPDYTFWADLNYTEYMSYIDQGMIAPLPDGWEAQYPNLHALIEASGIADKLKVDGRTYAVPKVAYYLFPPIDRNVNNAAVYYRKDMADKAGVEIGSHISIDAFADSIEKILSLDEARAESMRGLTIATDYLIETFMSYYNDYFNSFKKVDGQYVLGATLDGTIEGIKKLRELYTRGILDPDCYLYPSNDDTRNVFATGGSAALIYGGASVHYNTIAEAYQASNDVDDVFDVIHMTVLSDDDQLWHGFEYANFWSASLFSPTINEETFHRILALLDYLSTVEGQELISLGIKGKDWEKDNSGEYVILRPADETGSYPNITIQYPSVYMWYTLTVLPDSFGFVDPSIDARVRTAVNDEFEFKLNGAPRPFDADIFFYTSDVKSQFSIDFNSAIMRMVIDSNTDIEVEWNAFVEEHRSMWEPLLKEYNEAFGE